MSKTDIPQINIDGILRNMNEAELAQYNFDKAMLDDMKAQTIAKLAAKEAVLAKLGLTAEEAALLFP